MPRPDLYPAIAPQKSWEPDKWTARHRLVAQLSTMYSNAEIAQFMDLSPGRVSTILSDPRAALDIQDAVEAVSDNIMDLHDRLKALAVEAVDDLAHTMRHSKDEKLRTKVNFGILDRAGYTPVHKHMAVAPELPADIADRVEAALAEVREPVIDAEYEFVPFDAEAIPEEELDGQPDD